MLGYAVQALQAGSKARQAAIHQQALKEQQEVRAAGSAFEHCVDVQWLSSW